MSAEMKKGAGSNPGMEALGKNPAMVRSQAPSGERRRSRGSLDRAWSSDRRLPVAKANKKASLQVKNCWSGRLDQTVGLGLEAKKVRTRVRSQGGTWGLVRGLAKVKLRSSRDRVGWCPRGTPAIEPITAAREERYEAMVWGAKPRTS